MRTSRATQSTAASRPWRWLPWFGFVFIAAMGLHAAYDIHRHRAEVVAGTEHDLEAQARVIAEQTARSLQAIDLVLGHLAESLGGGRAEALGRDALHQLLKTHAGPMVQVQGIALFDTRGDPHAASNVTTDALPRVNFAQADFFSTLRDDERAELVIGNAQISPGRPQWIFPVARRVRGADGRFAGVIGAACRIEYFQRFYGETFPDQKTRIAMAHRKGWLLARNPPADTALGKPLGVLDELLPPGGPRQAVVSRLPSPVDGVDHFVAVRAVPDYPLIVAVSREASAALAPWRSQSIATAIRTLALGAFAGVLLWTALRLLDRSQAQRAALEASEERYQLAMTGSGEGHWLWDIPARQVYISGRLAEIFGFAGGAGTVREEDYFGRLPVHPDDRARVEHNRNEHLAGRTPRLEHEFRVVLPQTGEVRWVRTSAQCFRDERGRPQRLAGSTTDVTERRRADDALRESEERYGLAMAGSRGGHWVYDTKADTLFVSPRLNEMFGLPADSPAASRGDYFKRIPLHPDDRSIQAAMTQEMLSGRREKTEYECRIVLPEGVRWMLTRAQRFADADGKSVRVAGVSIDITDRKQAELEHQRLGDQLRQAQKLEAIGTLAGGIAHDFNNILSAILGYGELAQREAREGSALRRYVDAAMSAGQRAKSLVERILAFSRSGMGQRVPVHVPTVVNEALDGLLATLPPHVQLVRSVVQRELGVLGDPTQVHQVVLNLCANAVQSMGAGGRLAVTLDLCDLAEPTTVATHVLPPGPYLRLRVQDSGSGIAPEVLRRIFDPFFTTKEVGVGTGLGLSLVHGIVADLDGGIDVHSEPGRGSCFTVYLPVIEAAAPASAAAAGAVPQGAGQTVLLVDDEEPLVQLGEDLLEALGYTPIGFNNGRAALAALRADPQQFDVVLTDEAMPGFTGSELVEQVRALRPELPVVMMSGHVTPALLERARALGVHEVLSKPLASADIARALAGALAVAPRTAPPADPVTPSATAGTAAA
ncbi:MAG: PAS domain S-box protein [Rubrivivax sp.]